MAQNHIVTAVIQGENEARLAAYFNDEKDFLVFEIDNKEVFRMDYDNFKKFSELIFKNKE